MIVRVKDGVCFTRIAPGGFRLLGAIERIARATGINITITSACDGGHSGSDDPHHRGEAYDLRTHDMNVNEKACVLSSLITDVGGGFYAFLESAGTPSEPNHSQVRKGAVYP